LFVFLFLSRQNILNSTWPPAGRYTFSLYLLRCINFPNGNTCVGHMGTESRLVAPFETLNLFSRNPRGGHSCPHGTNHGGRPKPTGLKIRTRPVPNVSPHSGPSGTKGSPCSTAVKKVSTKLLALLGLGDSLGNLSLYAFWGFGWLGASRSTNCSSCSIDLANPRGQDNSQTGQTCFL